MGRRKMMGIIGGFVRLFVLAELRNGFLSSCWALFCFSSITESQRRPTGWLKSERETGGLSAVEEHSEPMIAPRVQQMMWMT